MLQKAINNNNTNYRYLKGRNIGCEETVTIYKMQGLFKASPCKE